MSNSLSGGVFCHDDDGATSENDRSRRDGRLRYRLFGLTLESPRPLPFLRAEPDRSRASDVRVVFAPIEPSQTPIVHAARGLSLHDDGSILFDSGHGLRFAVVEGRQITADVPSDLSDAELHAWLFGPPMACLLQQRGTPPLHACVLRIGTVAVALAGQSGAGKSTLARALIERGHRFLTDDQALIDPKTMLVQPSFPALKLRVESEFLTAADKTSERQIKAGDEKFLITQSVAFHDAPVRLALVIAVGRHPTVRSTMFCDLTQREKEAMLQFHLVRADSARRVDGGRTAFEWTLAVANAVPVVALEHPDDLTELPSICDEIERRTADAEALLFIRHDRFDQS